MKARFAIGLLLVGCGSDPAIMPQPQTMQASIFDTVDEGQAYLANVRAISAMPAVYTEVERHRTRMVAILGDMDTGIGSMSHCMDVTVIDGDRRGLIYELQMHIAYAYEQDTIDALRIEVNRHVNVNERLVEDMQAALDSSRCPAP